MRIKTVMNHNQNDGLLKMIRRTDPMILGKLLLKAEDVGNYNFGVVAKAYGIPEKIALQGAGFYQIYSGTSSPDWERWNLVLFSTVTPSGIISTSRKYILLPPYGDDPRDQHWIKLGYKYNR